MILPKDLTLDTLFENEQYVLTSLEELVSVKTAETTTAHREAAAGCTILKKNVSPVPLNGRRGQPKTGGKRFKAIREMNR